MCVYQEQAKQLLKHARIRQQSMRRPIMYPATEQISDHTLAEWITIVVGTPLKLRRAIQMWSQGWFEIEESALGRVQ